MVARADPYTKSKLGSVSDQPNAQLSIRFKAQLTAYFRELTLWLVAVAPSFDFV